MTTPKAIRLIVGLGNPGSEYSRTRHNAGFWFVDAVARHAGSFFHEERKFQGEVCKTRIAGNDVWLLKPSTYMNRSGDDELDLPPGCMKIKQGGGNAGHNGLKDISAKLSTPNFWRLRLGTGHPRTLGFAQQVADFVLSAPSSEHESAIETCIDAAIKEIDGIANGDFASVTRKLSKFSNPPKARKPENAK